MARNLRDELEQIYDAKMGRSSLSANEKKLVLDRLTKDLIEHQKKHPENSHLQKKEQKEFLVAAYCVASKDPQYKSFLQDQKLLDLLLTPLNQLKNTPELMKLFTKLKLFVEKNFEDLKKNPAFKPSPEQTKKLEELKKQSEEAMRNLQEAKNTKTPLSMHPEFKPLQMDFETMAIIHYRGRDTRTDTQATFTDTVIDGLYSGTSGKRQGEIEGPSIKDKTQFMDKEQDPGAPALTEPEEKEQEAKTPDYMNPFKTRYEPPGSSGTS